jgi:hypothetical protein
MRFVFRQNCFKKCVFRIAGVASSLILRDLKSQILEKAVPNDWLSAFSFKNARF